MARDGYRIFDSDTHVGPDARILAGYLSEAENDRLRGWEIYKSQGVVGAYTGLADVGTATMTECVTECENNSLSG